MLRLTEVFCSVQGESSYSGLRSGFVRFTGCPLRCRWCDTAYAFHGGEHWSVEQVLQRLESYRVKHVCVTGGEPLAQKACLPFLTTLCEAGYRVSLETSGALSVAQVDHRVKRVMDLKPPGSGESRRNLWKNIDYLQPHDEVKFVISDRADYDWSKAVLEKYQLWTLCSVLFSPVWQNELAKTLPLWILEDALPVRFQLQLHKIVWGADAVGV